MFELLVITSIVLTVVVALITKAITNPATMMMGVWTIILTGLYTLRGDYFEMDVFRLFFLFAMSLMFSSFALTTQGKISRGAVQPLVQPERSFHIVFIPLAIVSFLIIPLYVYQQLGLRGRSANILFNIRESSLDNGGSFFFDNFYLVILTASLFALYNFLVNRRLLNLTIYLSLMASGLILALFSGAKGEVINIIFASLVLYIMVYPRKQILATAFVGSILFALLMLGLFFINLAGDSSTYDFNFVRFLATDYIFGGAAAFSIHYDAIMRFENNQTFTNAYSSLVRALGYQAPDLSIHYPFVRLFDHRYTNVFTWAFPILKQFGMVGALLVSGLLGGFAGFLYRISLRNFPSMCIYIMLSISIVQSIFSDLFLYGSFRFIKLILFIAVFNALLNWAARYFLGKRAGVGWRAVGGA